MTIQEIRNTPEIVDFMLDKSVVAVSRMKLYNRLEEICELAIKALEHEPCEDCISREKAIKQCGFGMTSLLIADNLRRLPPVTPQQKMGCKGCKYEETGNNTTYPCSHCGRCYTDKYKVESGEV